MSFLIFDVDHSLASIGGDQVAERISSIKPIKITTGSTQVMETLSNLFTKEEKDIQHPLLSKSIKSIVVNKSDLANTHKLEGVVIDTISHLFRRDMRILETKNKSERLEMQDWGKLERVYNTLIASLIQLPVWVIVNSHISYEKNDMGQFLFYPQLKGSTKDFIAEYFDCILYTRVSNANGRIQWLWQTKPDNQRFAKDRLDVLEQVMPQDFSIVLSKYRENGIEFPKVLVRGESGTGKSRALLTLNKKPETPFINRNNGKTAIKLVN